jgi:hypothetical protein
LVIANIAEIRMFDLLDISVNKIVDQIVTGLIIGTGSAPVHQLIGIIQNTKDAIDGARQAWKGRANKDTAELVELLDELLKKEGTGEEPEEQRNRAEFERAVESLLSK